jgi:DNA polymerase III delta subunit
MIVGIQGIDPYQVNVELEKCIAEFGEPTVTLFGDELTSEDLSKNLLSMDLFSVKSIPLIKFADLIPERVDKEISHFLNIHRDFTIYFLVGDPAVNKFPIQCHLPTHLKKTIKSVGNLIEVKPLRKYDIIDFCKGYGLSKNISMDKEAINALINRCGLDRRRLVNEIDKILDFISEG